MYQCSNKHIHISHNIHSYSLSNAYYMNYYYYYGGTNTLLKGENSQWKGNGVAALW